MIQKCKFSVNYFDYEEEKDNGIFNCDQESIDSDLCIFHDKNNSKNDSKIHYQKIIEKFREKVKQAVDNNEKLLCFGYELPYFRFSDFVTIKKFTKPVYFIACHFYTTADFSGVEFQGNAHFDGSIFESNTDFSGAQFQEADFFQTHFTESVILKEAKFNKGVYFFNTIFCSEADFCDTQFQEIAYFLGTHFHNVYYRRAKFNGEAIFSGAQFLGPADFSKAQFHDVDFSRAPFIREVNFSSSQFNGHITFSEEQFSKSKPDFDKPNFSKAKFLTKVDFSNQSFPLGANFQEAQFYEIDFSETKFKQDTDFSSSKFQDITTFLGTEFSKKVDFTKAQFLGPADFSKAQFTKLTDFSKCKFHEIDFSETNFDGITNFSWSEFNDRTFFSSQFNNEANFNYVLFQGKEKVIFEVENLSFVSFLNTDIIYIRFSAVTKWTDEEVKFKVFDERRLEKIVKDEQHEKNSNNLLVKDINLGSIKAVYRSLRENYEYRRRYDEAGQFFIREMELKRCYREVPFKKQINIIYNNWFRRNIFSLTGWYYHLARYGENLRRPALVGTVIVSLSILFFLMQSNTSLEPTLPFFQNKDIPNSSTFSNFIGFEKANNVTHWLKSFERSFADFIPFLPSGNNIRLGIIDYIIKIVGSVLTFGFIAIALRRKFERKYTH